MIDMSDSPHQNRPSPRDESIPEDRSWPPPPMIAAFPDIHADSSLVPETGHNWPDIFLGFLAGLIAGVVCVSAGLFLLDFLRTPPHADRELFAGWAFSIRRKTAPPG